jgi:hypothetical protein
MRSTNLLVVASLFVALFGCGRTAIPNAAPTEESEAAPSPSVASIASEPASDVKATKSAAPVAPPADATPIAITFDNLKFDLAPDQIFTRNLITPETEALAERRVRIRGYINPFFVFRQTGLAQLLLVRDKRECCFGPEPPLCDCIWVTLTPGETTRYTIDPIEVEGTLRLEEGLDRRDGNPLLLYRLFEARVR